MVKNLLKNYQFLPIFAQKARISTYSQRQKSQFLKNFYLLIKQALTNFDHPKNPRIFNQMCMFALLRGDVCFREAMKKQNTVFTFNCLWHCIAILPFYFFLCLPRRLVRHSPVRRRKPFGEDGLASP